jgi:hypothetical protein
MRYGTQILYIADRGSEMSFQDFAQFLSQIHTVKAIESEKLLSTVAADVKRNSSYPLKAPLGHKSISS